MKKTLLILTSFLYLLSLSAQENKVDRTLNEIRSDISAKKTFTADDEVLFKPGNEMFVLIRLKSWMGDSVNTVRSQAVTFIARLGLNSREAAFRQEAIRLLVAEGNDKDASIAGSAITYLTHFNRSDFTRDVCDSVSVLLKEQSPHIELLIKLTGFLNLKDKQPFLQSLLAGERASSKLQWNIHLSLARMGNEGSIKTILDLVKIYPVDDNIIYHILPDLVFTRQKPVFNYLLEILNSDKKNCTSPNPSYTGNILCGYRVMEELTDAVIGFPLKKSKSGDIITNDYEKALQTVCDWFKANEEYEFNLEVY